MSLASLLAGGPLVITFFRGAWCPYCTIELEALGATLVAFSPQMVTHNLKTVRDYDLGFNLLSDAGNALANRLGIAYRVGERLIKAVYRPRGVELSQYNGTPSGECCCRRVMSSVPTARS